jgi:hypothetical protein
LGGNIAIHLIKVYTPYLLAFLLGVIVAWQGCNSEAKTITKVIEKPVPTVEYVDRWRTDTVRFVSKKVITRRDTIYQDRIVIRLDTMLLIDTLKIVETWLTEVANYDTTVNDVRLTWSNYQNRTENLKVQLRKKPLGWALGVHGLVGLQSDFVENYKPLFAIGLQATIKRTYISANYGFNGQHFIGVGVGRNIISR